MKDESDDILATIKMRSQELTCMRVSGMQSAISLLKPVVRPGHHNRERISANIELTPVFTAVLCDSIVSDAIVTIELLSTTQKFCLQSLPPFLLPPFLLSSFLYHLLSTKSLTFTLPFIRLHTTTEPPSYKVRHTTSTATFYGKPSIVYHQPWPT